MSEDARRGTIEQVELHPDIIGPYRIERTLGSGGMAVVFRARRLDAPESTPIALKVPRVGREDELTRAHLRAEIQAMARLTHPHVVGVLEWGETADGLIWFVMPELRARGLDEIEAELRPRALLGVIDRLLDALTYVHDRGVVHRDLKPENILIESRAEGPHPWLADFGVAAITTLSAADEGLAGTPAFLAPERLRRAGPAAPAEDLYALGVLLYWLFEGRLPFSGRTPLAIAYQHLTAPIPDFSERAVRPISPSLTALVKRLLAKNPLDRFPSASATRLALAAVDLPDAEPRGTAGHPWVALEPTRLVEASALRNRCGACGAPLDPDERRCAACGALRDTRAFESVDLRATVLGLGSAEPAESLTLVARGLPGRLHEAARRLRPDLAGEPRRHGVGWSLRFEAPDPSSLADVALEAAELALGLRESGAAEAVVVAPSGIAEGLLAHLSGGAVAVSEAIAARITHAFELGRLGDGGSGVLLQRRRAPEPPRALVGRERASSALLEAAARVVSRGRADCWFVQAPAGMGKSALLAALLGRLRAELEPIIASARPGDTAAPYQVLRRAVLGWCRGALAPDACLAPVDLAEALGARLPGHGEIADLDFAGWLLGRAALRSEDGRFEGHEAVRLAALLAGLAEEGPLLLVLDNAQWADASSLALLATLRERLTERPMLSLIFSREERPPPGAQVLELGALSVEAARALVAGEVDHPPPSDALDRLLALTGRHPFRLVQLAHLLAQGAAGLLDDTRPADALKALVDARLASLDAGARRVVEIAAVIGCTFPVPVLRGALGAEAPLARPLDAVLADLQQEALFAPAEGLAAGRAPVLCFVHDLLRDRAREICTPARAQVAHRQAAGWLEEGWHELDGGQLHGLAEHWEACGEDGRAAAWFFQVGRSALVVGATAEADEAFSRALRCVDRLGREGEPVEATVDPISGRVLPVDLPALLLDAARAAEAVADVDRADALAARVIQVREPRRFLIEAAACNLQARIARTRGQLDLALERIEAGLQALGEPGDRVMRALLLASRGWIRGYLQGDNEAGWSDGQAALSLLDGLRLPAVRSRIFSMLGANELRAGNWDGQLRCNRRALALAKEAGHLGARCTALVNLGVCCHNRGTLEEAEAHTRAAVELALRTGNQGHRLVALGNLGMILLDLDRVDEAQEVIERRLSLADRLDTSLSLAEAQATAARVELARGHLEDALALAERAEQTGRASGSLYDQALASRVRGQVLARMGATDAARAALLAALEVLGEDTDRYERAVVRLCLALLAAGGAQSEAVEAARAELRAIGADPDIETRRAWTGGAGSPTAPPRSPGPLDPSSA